MNELKYKLYVNYDSDRFQLGKIPKIDNYFVQLIENGLIHPYYGDFSNCEIEDGIYMYNELIYYSASKARLKKYAEKLKKDYIIQLKNFMRINIEHYDQGKNRYFLELIDKIEKMEIK